MKTKTYTVAQFAKIYKSKHGGSCHRNNIYHLIWTNRLPEGVKHFVQYGKNLLKVPVSYLESN